MSDLLIKEDPRLSQFLADRGPEDEPALERPIEGFAALVKRYKQLRELSLKQNKCLVKAVDKSQLHEGASRLNLLRGTTLFFDNEEDLTVLFDYSLNDVWRNGRNVLQKYLADSPPPADSDEMRLLQGKISARHSVFMIDKAVRGVGIEVRSLIRPERHAVMDVSLGNCAQPGVVIAMRLMEVEGICMSTGASIAGDGATFLRAVAELGRMNDKPSLLRDDLSPEHRSKITALIIRNFLAYRSAVIRSLEAADDPERLAPIKSAARVGRNDGCPCGSGVKYKKCCGR